jgi:hypothetical protein
MPTFLAKTEVSCPPERLTGFTERTPAGNAALPRVRNLERHVARVRRWHRIPEDWAWRAIFAALAEHPEAARACCRELQRLAPTRKDR